MTEFSPAVCERIEYYIYALVDPRSKKVFYIGKGKGNRVFQHAQGVVKLMSLDENENEDTLKISTIKDILKEGLTPSYYILRHGISVDNIAVKHRKVAEKETEKEKKDALSEGIAFELESLLIDFLSSDLFVPGAELSNIQSGHDQKERGIKTVEEIQLLYDPEKADVRPEDGLILVLSINNTYPQYKNDPDGVYRATRGTWVIGDYERSRIKCVIGLYNGIVRGVFFPKIWNKDSEYVTDKGWTVRRWSFTKQEELTAEQQDLYDRTINKALEVRFGSGNPVTYLNKK